MKLRNYFIGAILVLASYTQCLQGLPGGTKIFTGTDSKFVLIENIDTGDVVASCNLEEKTPLSVAVLEIYECHLNTMIEIKTAKGSIFSSPDQLFYDDALHDCVSARELTTESILLTRNLLKIRCTEIKQHCIKTACHRLVLEWPHLFFATDLEVLVHNALSSIPTVIGSLKDLLAWGMAIAYVRLTTDQKKIGTSPPVDVDGIQTLNLPNTNLVNTNPVSEQLLYDIAAFEAQYTKVDMYGRQDIFDPDKYFIHGRPVPANPPPIVGVTPDAHMYRNMRCNPLKFGPIFPLGIMTPTGDVVCMLYVMTFDRWIQTKPSFVWRTFGKQLLRRNDPFVKVFVEFEDTKQLTNLRDFIRTLPKGIPTLLFAPDSHTSEETEIIREKYGDLEKTIYEAKFGIHALYRMAQQGIPPSLVVQAIKYGTCMAAKDLTRLLYYDKLLDIAIALEKSSRKIVNVGRVKDIPVLDEQPPDPDDDEDPFKDNDEEDDERIFNDPKNAKTRKMHKVKTVPELLKDKKSFEQLIKDHRVKLTEFLKNPDACDNQNVLKTGLPQHRISTISGRAKNLTRQINKRQKLKLSIVKRCLRVAGIVI